MAHGPDTAELLHRFANIDGDRLDISMLNITSIPELPSTITRFSCYRTRISVLPELPSGLQFLSCGNTPLTSLPELPSDLRSLYCSKTEIRTLPELPPNIRSLLIYTTPISVLPQLPSKLEIFSCSNTAITVLPELPPGLRYLKCSGSPLILKRKNGESIQDYNERWREWREEQVAKKRCEERCLALKEDLMAAAWHPSRVARFTEGEWDELAE
jgi:Leucine-rich repeat (LRR) protein